ncbi:MAG: hypothetical protein WA070_07550 [Sphingobium sp.]
MAGNEFAEQLLVCAFNDSPLYGLAEFLAAAMTADIIRVARSRTGAAPIRCHRMAALATGGKTAQWKISIDVAADGSSRLAVQTLPNTLMCFERDDGLVMPLAKRHTPKLAFDITRINRIGQNAIYLLVRQEAVATKRKFVMSLKVAFHFRL